MTIKARDFDFLVEKLQLQTREGRDKLAWFVHRGKRVTFTKRSHGRGDLPFQHHIRQQLKLNEREFRGLLDCHLSRDDYIALLKQKSIIQAD